MTAVTGVGCKARGLPGFTALCILGPGRGRAVLAGHPPAAGPILLAAPDGHERQEAADVGLEHPLNACLVGSQPSFLPLQKECGADRSVTPHTVPPALRRSSDPAGVLPAFAIAFWASSECPKKIMQHLREAQRHWVFFQSSARAWLPVDLVI